MLHHKPSDFEGSILTWNISPGRRIEIVNGDFSISVVFPEFNRTRNVPSNNEKLVLFYENVLHNNKIMIKPGWWEINLFSASVEVRIPKNHSLSNILFKFVNIKLTPFFFSGPNHFNNLLNLLIEKYFEMLWKK